MVSLDGAGDVLLADKVCTEEHERIWGAGDVALGAALARGQALAGGDGGVGGGGKEAGGRGRGVGGDVWVWVVVGDGGDVGGEGDGLGGRGGDAVSAWFYGCAEGDWRG